MLFNLERKGLIRSRKKIFHPSGSWNIKVCY